MKAIVTVVGKDRVGIIASVCQQLASYNVNVLDISQTVMQGYFTMMMAVDVSQANVSLPDLCQLMEQNKVTEAQIRKAVASRGYYPEATPIKNYDPDFVSGVLVGAWPQVYQLIKENN